MTMRTQHYARLAIPKESGILYQQISGLREICLPRRVQKEMSNVALGSMIPWSGLPR